MKTNLLIILSVLFLSSCVTQNRCNRKYPPETKQHDSIYIERERHDTTVLIQYKPDTARAVQPSSKPSYLSNKYCTSTARVDSGLLYHDLITVAQTVPVTFRDVIRKDTRVQFHTVWLTKSVRYVPFLVKLLAWVGGISILYVVVRLILRRVI